MAQWYSKWGQCLARNCNFLRAHLEKLVLMFMLKVLGKQRFGQTGGKSNVFLKSSAFRIVSSLTFLITEDKWPLRLQSTPWGLRSVKKISDCSCRSGTRDFRLWAFYFKRSSNTVFLASCLVRFVGDTYLFLPLFHLVPVLFALGSPKKTLTIMVIISVTCGSVDGLKQNMNVHLESRQNLNGT